MHLSHVTFVLVAVLSVVVLAALLVVYRKYKKLSVTASSFKKHLALAFPEIQHLQYSNIHYEPLHQHHETSLKNPGTPPFDLTVAKTLCSSIMSTYNRSMGYSPRLPTNMSIVTSIGTNGCVYKMTNSGNNTAATTTYIYSFRGTMSKKDFLTDLTFSQVPLIGQAYHPDGKKVLVHKGFYELWKRHLNEIVKHVSEIAKEPGARVYVTGHSMGAALAAYTALELAKRLPRGPILYLFAPPRAGNQVFTQEVKTLVPHHWAHVNVRDIICELPPSICPTFTRTYIYDDYKNVYRSDYQSGEFVGNHHLDAYVDVLDGKIENDSLWNRESMMLKTE